MSLGRSVVDGLIRFTSVSQIERFDASTYGGCERKWWFRYIRGTPDKQRPAQALGEQVHSQIEHYLKTGQDVLGDLARSGKHFIPEPGGDLKVEYAFGRSDNGRVVSALVADDVPVIGKVDLGHARDYWLDTDGEKQPLEGPEIVDWKTTKQISTSPKGRGFAKTAAEIAKQWQTLGYARLALDLWPGCERVRVGHGYFQTQGPREAEKRSTVLTAEQIQSGWVRADSLVRRMKAVAKTSEVTDVEANLDSCMAYGGCTYREQCPRNPKLVLLSVFGGKKSMGLLESFRAKEAAKKSEAPAELKPEVRAEMDKLLDEERAARITPPDVPAPKEIADPMPDGMRAPEPTLPCTVSNEARKLTAEQAADRAYPCTCGESVKVKPKKMPDGSWQALVPEHGSPATEKAERKPRTKRALEPTESAVTIPVGETACNGHGLELYLDCRRDGAHAQRLEVYAAHLAADLAEHCGVLDVRAAGADSPIGFGKWKGHLAAMAREKPPQAGPWEVSSSSELGMVVFEALTELAVRVVRGA